MFGRVAALNFVRLVFTLLEAHSSSPPIELLQVASSILEEELSLRPQVFSQGVRSLSHLVQMPKNSFSSLDKVAMDYDERRVCHVCKCICVFSAIVCECSYIRVACIRHDSLMCKCSRLKNNSLISTTNLFRSRKSMLEWISLDELKTEIIKIKGMINSNKSRGVQLSIE